MSPDMTDSMARGAFGLAAFAALLSALIHALGATEHFVVWWGYGAFFVIAAVAELVLGLLLMAYASGNDRTSPLLQRARRPMLVAGIAGNLVLLAMYAWTRMVGHFAGPLAGFKEGIEPLDLVSQAAEATVVLALGLVLGWARK